MVLVLAFGSLSRRLGRIAFFGHRTDLFRSFLVNETVRVHRVESMRRFVRHFDFLSQISDVKLAFLLRRGTERTSYGSFVPRSVARLQALVVLELEHLARRCGSTPIACDAVLVALLLILCEVVVHIGYQEGLRLIGVPQVHLSRLLLAIRCCSGSLTVHEGGQLNLHFLVVVIEVRLQRAPAELASHGRWAVRRSTSNESTANDAILTEDWLDFR